MHKNENLAPQTRKTNMVFDIKSQSGFLAHSREKKCVHFVCAGYEWTEMRYLSNSLLC